MKVELLVIPDGIAGIRSIKPSTPARHTGWRVPSRYSQWKGR